MSWALPIAEIRTIVAEGMYQVFGLGDAAAAVARTKYPDQNPLQDFMDAKDAAAMEDGFTETYRVITPGIVAPPAESGTCDRNTFPLPLRIYICRRVSDTPHDDGATMLDRASELADHLWAQAVPWETEGGSEVAGMADRHMVRMTTEFPEADEMNAARWAAVLLEINLEMENTN